jgi:SAM-dependent methyltransferase
VTGSQRTPDQAESFNKYADWYDRFNDDKDYPAESTYVLRKVSECSQRPETWLDVGCGTGHHVAALTKMGIHAEGVDSSALMVAQASNSFPGIPFHIAQADEFNLRVGWDVISMLFHVVNYITVRDVLEATLRNIAAHLKPKGALVLDFWHSGGVRFDPPRPRVRSKRIDGREMFRVSLPSEHESPNTINVVFEFRWDSEDGPLIHRETHLMRHFSIQELESFLHNAGLKTLQCQGWMKDRALEEHDWYGLIVAERP